MAMRHGAMVALLWAVVLGDPGAARQAPAPPTLARDWTVQRLEAALVPRASWRPLPPGTDRQAWDGVSASLKAALIAAGDRAMAKPIPSLPATRFLEYARIGNRSGFEGDMFARRDRLHALVLAEGAEWRGRYLDAIVDTVWAIAEESSWTVPAHQGAQKMGQGLPDTTEPIVDLFSAQTAHSFAWTSYVLGERLDQVSPLVRTRMEREVRRRVLEPYLARDDFWWMGFAPRASRPNNWNPWINANVVAAALLVEADSSVRAALVHKALRSLDRYLGPHPIDGGCDEGPNYWSRAAGSLFEALELLHSATAGQLDVYANPVVADMGRFIYRARIAGTWFVDVGDSNPRVHVDRALAFRYGRAIGDARLEALGAAGAQERDLALDDRSLGRALASVFSWNAMAQAATARAPLARDVWLPSADLQLMAARDRADSTDGLFVAAWASHNGQSHNHNDVGNLVVFADGDPVLVDLGRPAYTAQTFSSRRYDIGPMQSAFHNVPMINGVMQQDGTEFAATRVAYALSEAAAELSMELAGAYPPSAGVRSWMRRVRLERGRAVVLSDTFALQAATAEIRNHLVTACEADEEAPGRVRLLCGRVTGRATHVVRLGYDARALRVSFERVAVDDEQLARVWGDHVVRVAFTAREPVQRGTWTVTISR